MPRFWSAARKRPSTAGGMAANVASTAGSWRTARTGESGSRCADRKRAITASSDGLGDTARSRENAAGSRFIDAFAFSSLPYYGECVSHKGNLRSEGNRHYNSSVGRTSWSAFFIERSALWARLGKLLRFGGADDRFSTLSWLATKNDGLPH